VLLVTTTMRVFNRVHGNTTNNRPAVALCLELVVLTASLEHWLVNTTTTSNNTDGSTAASRDHLLCTRGETNAGSAVILVLRDDGGVVTRSACDNAAVTSICLDVADDGTFRELADGENVADLERCSSARDDGQTGVDTLRSNDELLAAALAILLGVLDDREERATAGVVDDLLDETLVNTNSLSTVERAVLSRALTVLVVCAEDSCVTLTLS